MILNNSPLMDIFFLYLSSIILGVIVILTHSLYVRGDTNESDNKIFCMIWKIPFFNCGFYNIFIFSWNVLVCQYCLHSFGTALGSRGTTKNKYRSAFFPFCIHMFRSTIVVLWNIKKPQDAPEKGQTDDCNINGLNNRRYKGYLSSYFCQLNE